jgi:hypothetical protein
MEPGPPPVAARRQLADRDVIPSRPGQPSKLTMAKRNNAISNILHTCMHSTLLSLDADNLKIILSDFPVTMCRMVCKRFKCVAEQFFENSIMLTEVGAGSVDLRFLRKFNNLSIGSSHGWSCYNGWLAVTLAGLRQGMNLNGLRIAVTEKCIAEIIDVLDHLLSTQNSCIKILTLDFTGSSMELQKHARNLEALSHKLKIEMNWEIGRRYSEPPEFLMFDTLSASVSLRSLNFL